MVSKVLKGNSFMSNLLCPLCRND